VREGAQDVAREDRPLGRRMVLVGGLVPRYLVSAAIGTAGPHIGTTDLDVVLGVALATDEEEVYRTLQRNLVEAQFHPGRDEDTGQELSYRWQRDDVDGVRVVLEFFCPVGDGEPGRLRRNPTERGMTSTPWCRSRWRSERALRRHRACGALPLCAVLPRRDGRRRRARPSAERCSRGDAVVPARVGDRGTSVVRQPPPSAVRQQPSAQWSGVRHGRRRGVRWLAARGCRPAGQAGALGLARPRPEGSVLSPGARRRTVHCRRGPRAEAGLAVTGRGSAGVRILGPNHGRT
jgi:hypothetical protein